MKRDSHLRLIGNVLKTFGTNGELIVKLREEAPPAILQNEEPIFIYIDGLSVPFYMKLAEPKGTNKLLVVFEDMEAEALAAELVGKEVYQESEEAEASLDNELDVLVGFTAIDKKHGTIGLVDHILAIPGNPCLVVIKDDGQEVIIPLNEELISGVDSRKKQIRLDVPDGLLDLYS